MYIPIMKMVHTQPMRCSLDSEFSDTHERVWHSDIYTEVKCKLKQMVKLLITSILFAYQEE